MSELILILALVAGLLYWQNSMRCKEVAMAAARAECERAGLQYLGELYQKRISMSRDTEQRWRLWHDYRFAYSADGRERARGRILLLGQRVVSVDLESSTTILH